MGKIPAKPAAREDLFIADYLTHFNGARAAVGVGYAPESAATAAMRMLARPSVIAKIRAKVEETVIVHGVTHARVMQELAGIAFANLHDYMVEEDDGTRSFDMSRLNKHNMAPISEIKVRETVTNEGETRTVTRNVTLKFHDKLGALEKLAKITGMYEPPQPPPVPTIDNRTVNNNVVITSQEALAGYRRLMDGGTVETAPPDADE